MTGRWYLLLFYALSGVISYAQDLAPDTSFLAVARSYPLELYNQAIHGQARIYNGTEYRDYFSRNDEHPYFGIDDWAYGDVYYDDELYKNVPLFYDISRDRIITEHMLNGAKLELINEKIKRFSLDEHQFIRITDSDARVIPSGFVEILYDGQTKVYARREKNLVQKVESNDIIARFDVRDRLYIKKGNSYYPVKKKRSVLAVFSDKKSELKTFLNKNKITFNLDREAAIAQMAEFYDAQ